MTLRATVARLEGRLRSAERQRRRVADVRSDAARLVGLMVARTVGLDVSSAEAARAFEGFPSIGEGIGRLEAAIAAREDKTPQRRRAASAAGRKKGCAT
jgi:hypothetical protein